MARPHLIIDKILIPTLLLGTLGFEILVRSRGHHSYVIFECVKVVGIVAFLWAARPPKVINLTVSAYAGIILSYLAPLFLSPTANTIAPWVEYISVANAIFYCGITLLAYSWLGRNLSVVPSLRAVVKKGLYCEVRHPIYSGYLHLAASFVLLFPSILNIALLGGLFAGLHLRAREEERVLSLDPEYLTLIAQVRTRFFSWGLSIPLVVLAVIAGCFKLSSDKAKLGTQLLPIQIQLADPVLSLNPLVYDDWGSVFIGNHIYRRLLQESGRPSVPYVADNFKIICSETGTEAIPPTCAEVQVTFRISPFTDCNGNLYSRADIVNEFEKVLAAKTWVLPNWRRCSTRARDEDCYIGKARPDIIRRFQNLYFRFGWTKGQNHKSSDFTAVRFI